MAKRKRYTQEEKAKLVAWVNEYNEKNGRGGVANASKKFEIAQLTLSKWVKEGEEGPSISSSIKGKGVNAEALRALADLVEEIAIKENELKTLHKKYNVLKNKI